MLFELYKKFEQVIYNELNPRLYICLVVSTVVIQVIDFLAKFFFLFGTNNIYRRIQLSFLVLIFNSGYFF